MSITVITNNVPRLLIDGWDLTDAERETFDYIDWSAIDAGEDSATFFRYKGTLYNLGEFMANLRETGDLAGWDGFMADTFFSAIIVKFDADDNDRVIVGRCYS